MNRYFFAKLWRFARRSSLAVGLLSLATLPLGCSRSEPTPPAATDAPTADAEPSPSTAAPNRATGDSAATGDAAPIDAQRLLAARLPIADSRQGWVRLFDGQSLFGWEIAGDANWRVEEGAIVVDEGEIGLLNTSVPWQDFELRMEFRTSATTNSGIFLRTPTHPQDPASDCYEVNIAPPDNPFPTGSIVGRVRSPLPLELDESAWHLIEMRMVGDTLTVDIDGQRFSEFVDPQPLGPGRIGLQHNQGPVAFRDVRVRPLGMRQLINDDLDLWKRYPEMDGDFQITEEGLLRVTGGRGQLESTESFDDFVLLAEAKTASDRLNSGIFFRCIPGETMNGYECQINHETIDGDPLLPADCGTGGIFRRHDARIVAAEDGEWFTMMLIANGPRIAAWVNGLQVTDWVDTRAPDPNPRRGLRLEAGTLMIQAHDPTTDLVFKRIDVVPLSRTTP